jgi:hypothetical protein
MARRSIDPPERPSMPHRLRVHLVLIGLDGFAGAVARYLVDGWISGATGGG